SINLKDIYDVRIELIGIEGNRISQVDLLNLLNYAFAKRIVDRWILRHTVTQLTEMSAKPGNRGNVKFALKISLTTVSDSKFIPWLKELLNDADPPSGCLMFEIEASEFLRGPEQYKPLIEGFGKFYDIKFILSGVYQIDTYYQVHEIQKFSYIKLNVKDLIFGFPRNPLYKLIDTLKDDGVRIVAINVADAETLNLATDFDIDYVHGYLVGKPLNDVIADSEGDLHYII
ncbi:MAG: EAL domain-containing protein, partial [Gammaproteobacteria bacterium]